MSQKSKLTPFFLICSCVIIGFCTFSPALAADFLSPVAIVANEQGDTLYIAEATASEVSVFDVKKGGVSKTIQLPANPSGLVLSPDGRQLYVAANLPQGKIMVIDLASDQLTDSIMVGHSPLSPVLSPDGKTLYVCNKFNNNIGVVDLKAKKQVATIPVDREPSAMAISPDGKTLVVANEIPSGPTDGDYAASVVSMIDTASMSVTSIPLPNGSIDLKGACISPDGKHAYVTHILARYQLPTTQLERGWMSTNALTVIDVATKKTINTILLDDVDLGAANPWGVACTSDGKSICIALSGTHEVLVIDRVGLNEKLTKVAAGGKVSDASNSYDDVPNDLAFLVGLKKRLRLSGNGPRGMAIVGTNVYVGEYFTDSLGVVDVGANTYYRPAESIQLSAHPKEMTVVRKGEMFFNDASLCFQKWLSCSTCHPSDARSDALNWDLLNDGIGNPKQSRKLLLSHETPPVMVSGIRENAEIAVRAGIRYIQFAVRPEEDAVAIDEYLKSLKPIPSPYLVNGKMSASGERGKKVFDKANCNMCHSGVHYTDMQKYDVGTGKGREEGIELDTPSLVEAWRSSPYLHDGRAGTMEDVFKKFNKGDMHGETSGLTEKELADLVMYLLSL
ncbi:MAG: beta-propeller fold lactonase family protein [Phycisphaerae bacterium]|nr:beta-propeller fold lactonase family protein [Phycisphaerae bacterium]